MDSIAIYAHFSCKSDVNSDVFEYLRCLRENGFDLFFVTTSHVSPGSSYELSKICVKTLAINNVGLDFYMWKSAIDRIPLNQYRRLILTNSSIIGPMNQLSAILQIAESKEYKFWGMTENSWYCRHLQSYFLVFDKEILQESFFADFWKHILPWESKAQIIVSYEIGLTNWMAQHGYDGIAIFPETIVWEKYRSNRTPLQLMSEVLRGKLTFPQNVSLEFPDILLELGTPFLKRSLLSKRSIRFTPEKAISLLNNYQQVFKPSETTQRPS